MRRRIHQRAGIARHRILKYKALRRCPGINRNNRQHRFHHSWQVRVHHDGHRLRESNLRAHAKIESSHQHRGDDHGNQQKKSWDRVRNRLGDGHANLAASRLLVRGKVFNLLHALVVESHLVLTELLKANLLGRREDQRIAEQTDQNKRHKPVGSAPQVGKRFGRIHKGVDDARALRKSALRCGGFRSCSHKIGRNARIAHSSAPENFRRIYHQRTSVSLAPLREFSRKSLKIPRQTLHWEH